jgi:uncharacterized membrane protein YecN with MAPEG domain
VTGSFLAPFFLFNFGLAVNVVRTRRQAGIFLGDKTKSPETTKVDPLFLNTRLHGNFLENVPLALVAAAVVELNGGSRKVLTYTLSALFLARISHVVGLTQNIQGFRAAGFLSSIGIVTGLGTWGAYLAKGYWGL